MFGLDVDALGGIEKTLAQFPRIQKVLLYGSRAMGNYRKGSDIDITLIGNGLTLQNTIYPLMNKLDSLYLPYKFDVSIFQNLDNPEFVEHILRVGKIFYQRKLAVADGWTTRALGDLCQIELGRTPARNNPKLWDARKTTNNVWLSIADIPKTINARVSDSKEYISDEATASGRLVAKGTLLVSFKLTLGRLAFAGCDLYTNEAIAALSIFNEKEIMKKYLYWYLTYFDWEKAAAGEEKIKGKTLNKNKLKNLPVILPPVSEQKQIVDILDKAFDAVETAISNTRKNFSNAWGLFENRLDSTFSRCPSTWKPYKLSDVCSLHNGRAYKKAELLSEGKYPVLRVGNFFTNRNWYYSDLELENTKYCDTGDLLYAWSASFGPKIWDGGKVIFHYHIWRIDVVESLVFKKFLFYWLEWDADQIKAEQGAGTTMVHVSKKSMDARRIVLPSINVQKDICAQLDCSRDKSVRIKKAYADKISLLAKLKQSLLHQAFTGELTSNPFFRSLNT